MDRCDVLIAGGGPAGSSCAFGLRDSGLDVLVMDRSEFPRDKICAGWVTPPVFRELAIDPEQYAVEKLIQPIRGFRVRRIGQAESRVLRRSVISYGIRRCEFDDYLLRRCEARLRLGEGVQQLERQGQRWVVNGSIEARVLVGAGGHFCPVARRLTREDGPAAGNDPVVAAQEIEFELDAEARERCPVQAELPEIFFTEDLAGYGWLFRKGNFLNLGLGRQDRGRLSEHRERFLAFLRTEGRLDCELPSGFRGHAYLIHGQASRPLAVDGALLVGDAAGLAYPRSGEGIRPAVESGLLAARSIRAARGRYDLPTLAPYCEAIERRLGRRDPVRRPGPTDLLPAPLAHSLAGRLLATRWFAGRVVVDRWFVRSDQGPLPTG